jgi:hypothetical protein
MTASGSLRPNAGGSLVSLRRTIRSGSPIHPRVYVRARRETYVQSTTDRQGARPGARDCRRMVGNSTEAEAASHRFTQSPAERVPCSRAVAVAMMAPRGLCPECDKPETKRSVRGRGIDSMEAGQIYSPAASRLRANPLPATKATAAARRPAPRRDCLPSDRPAPVPGSAETSSQ